MYCCCCRERAAQLGLSSSLNTSLDLNQTFPLTEVPTYTQTADISAAQDIPSAGCTLDKFKGQSKDMTSLSENYEIFIKQGNSQL